MTHSSTNFSAMDMFATMAAEAAAADAGQGDPPYVQEMAAANSNTGSNIPGGIRQERDNGMLGREEGDIVQAPQRSWGCYIAPVAGVHLQLCLWACGGGVVGRGLGSVVKRLLTMMSLDAGVQFCTLELQSLQFQFDTIRRRSTLFKSYEENCLRSDTWYTYLVLRHLWLVSCQVQPHQAPRARARIPGTQSQVPGPGIYLLQCTERTWLTHNLFQKHPG